LFRLHCLNTQDFCSILCWPLLFHFFLHYLKESSGFFHLIIGSLWIFFPLAFRCFSLYYLFLLLMFCSDHFIPSLKISCPVHEPQDIAKRPAQSSFDKLFTLLFILPHKCFGPTNEYHLYFTALFTLGFCSCIVSYLYLPRSYLLFKIFKNLFIRMY
jgi:hypothetical protein